MIFTKGKMYRGFIISCGGSFESSWRSGLDFGTRIHYRESFIMSKLVTMCIGNVWYFSKQKQYTREINTAFKENASALEIT